MLQESSKRSTPAAERNISSLNRPRCRASGSSATATAAARHRGLPRPREEGLVLWVKDEVPGSFFHDSNADDVSSAFAEIMLWVQRSAQYLDRAKAKFATEADGWLVAYSMVHRTVMVTNEQPRPDLRNRVLLPDVCDQFKVPYKDTFVMLRELAVRFDLVRAR
ncbi:MAG: DUF4411 family protein [Acidimicrobiia bacterium]|nr:DUF4411 family protein [Acidimicrobiia bacterium]